MSEEFLAAIAGQDFGKCIALLTETPSLVNAEVNGKTIFHVALLSANCSLVNSLLAFKGSFTHANASLLKSAVDGGCVKCIGAVVYDLGVAIDSPAEGGATVLFTAIESRKTALVQFLLEHGANPNTVAAGATPLHVAAAVAEVEDIRLIIGFGGDIAATNGAGATPLDVAKSREKANAAVVKELSKPAKSAATRGDDAARFKAHGNRVFAEGENVKAAKFYSQAILNDQLNHVYFSNRAACNFNLKEYDAAYLDACRCIALSPKFARGYFRKAAAQSAQKDVSGARKTIADGLAVEPQNKDLLTLLNQMNKN